MSERKFQYGNDIQYPINVLENLAPYIHLSARIEPWGTTEALPNKEIKEFNKGWRVIMTVPMKDYRASIFRFSDFEELLILQEALEYETGRLALPSHAEGVPGLNTGKTKQTFYIGRHKGKMYLTAEDFDLESATPLLQKSLKDVILKFSEDSVRSTLRKVRNEYEQEFLQELSVCLRVLSLENELESREESYQDLCASIAEGGVEKAAWLVPDLFEKGWDIDIYKSALCNVKAAMKECYPLGEDKRKMRPALGYIRHLQDAFLSKSQRFAGSTGDGHRLRDKYEIQRIAAFLQKMKRGIIR